MKSKWSWRLVLCLFCTLFFTAFVSAEYINFLGGETLPSGWSITPANPTVKDIIYFSGPLNGVYSNACYAKVAASYEPALSVTTGSIKVQNGTFFPPTTVCPTVHIPVCGLGGNFGPLAEGDYVMTNTYPIAQSCNISFHVFGALTIVKPNGGENFVAGNKETILWETDGSSTNILVEYSTNNGTDWTGVSPANTGNTGSYEWTVPDINSQQCLVRVSDVADPNIKDTSNDVFTIFICEYPPAGDLNDDCYVDFRDLAILAMNWLKCGNPYDANCF